MCSTLLKVLKLAAYSFARFAVKMIRAECRIGTGWQREAKGIEIRTNLIIGTIAMVLSFRMCFQSIQPHFLDKYIRLLQLRP